MAIFGRKIRGCVRGNNSARQHISLIELADGKSRFLRFVLLLKIVRQSKKRVRVVRVIDLEETDGNDAIKRYFLPRGGVREDFPEITDKQWKITQPWLLKVANSGRMKSDWMRIDKSYGWSRPKSGFRFWKRHACKRALLIGVKSSNIAVL